MSGDATEPGRQLYRHYDAKGKLLYIGVSLSAVLRLNGHCVGSPWFSRIAVVRIEHYLSHTEARHKEREAIALERPKYNKIYNKPRIPPAILRKIIGAPVMAYDKKAVMREAKRRRNIAAALRKLGSR